MPGDSTTSLTTTTVIDPAFGQPVKKTDPNNLVTNLAYDALGRLLKVFLAQPLHVPEPECARYAPRGWLHTRAPVDTATCAFSSGGRTSRTGSAN